MLASIDGDFPVRIVVASKPGGLVDLWIGRPGQGHRLAMLPDDAERLARSILAAVELARLPEGTEPEGK